MSKEKLSTQLAAKADIPKKIVYIGPTLPGLKTFTSFTGGIPAEGQALIKRDERYNRLFTSTSNFIKALKEIKEGGLGEIYRAAVRERF